MTVEDVHLAILVLYIIYIHQFLCQDGTLKVIGHSESEFCVGSLHYPNVYGLTACIHHSVLCIQHRCHYHQNAKEKYLLHDINTIICGTKVRISENKTK